LCVQCGACVPVCPSRAIRMRETPSGLLVASINEEKCDGCGLCRAICPGAGISLQGLHGADPFKGNVLQAYAGHAGNEAIRASGQSGGIVSALLFYLLESGRIDAALVVAMPNDGSLRPRPVLARTRAEVLASQGSKYCPVAPGALLEDVREGERIAMVGIPCQMHGIHNLSRQGNPLAERIEYRIGLFCDRTLLFSCIEMMARQARLRMDEISGLEFRSKSRHGWPGEVCFALVSGEKRFFPASLRTNLKDLFTPPRCRLCFDKLNVFSDLAVGDAWGISPSARGDSVILARSEKGVLLLQEAAAHGFLRLEKIGMDRVFQGQNIERKRLDFSSFMELAGLEGRPLPRYEGLAPGFLKTVEKSLAARNRRRLNYDLAMARSISREEALAMARAWRRKQRRTALGALLFRRMRETIRALFHPAE